MIGGTNVGGGGGDSVSKINSYIAVTYPAGSACTCSNGTKTLRAKNTSGVVVFSIPSAGDWTVNSTNGTLSRSHTITVAAGNIYNLNIVYSVYLLQNGVFNTEITGGNEFTGNCSLSDGKIVLTRSGTNGGGFTFANAIDITNYSRIVFTVTQSNYLSYPITCGAGSTKSKILNLSAEAVSNTDDTTNTPVTVIADISSITGNWYVGAAGVCNATITEIVLE